MAVDPRTLPFGPNYSFGDNFAAFADNFALFLENPLNLDQFVPMSDAAAASAVTAPQAPGELQAAAGQAVDELQAAAGRAVNNTLLQVGLWGGAGLIGILALQKLARR